MLSVIRFGKISPLWQKFKRLWQYFQCLFWNVKNFELTLHKIMYTIGQSFIAVNDPKWKHKLTIWSNWLCSMVSFEQFVWCWMIIHFYFPLKTFSSVNNSKRFSRLHSHEAIDIKISRLIVGPARPACLHCQFNSPTVHCKNGATYPPMNTKVTGQKKLNRPGQILPPPSCLLLWVGH